MSFKNPFSNSTSTHILAALAAITTQLARIERKIDAMADDQAAVDSELQTVIADLAPLQTSSAAILAKLAATPAGSPAPDFTNEVAQLRQIDAGLKALNEANEAAAGSTSPATPAAPPPTA